MTIVPARGSSINIWNILRTLLAILLAWFVFSKTDVQRFPVLFERISLLALFYYIVLFLLLTFLKALQYYILLGDGVSYLQIVNVVVLQNAFSNYFASSAGVLSYLAVLRGEHDVKISRSAKIFVLIKIGDLAVIWLALCVSSYWVWSTIVVFHNIVIWLQIGIGCFIFVFILLVFFQQKLVSPFGEMANRLYLSRLSGLRKAAGFLQFLADIKPSQLARMFLAAFLLSLTYFVINIVLINVNYMVFDFRQDLRQIIFVSTLMQIVSYLPVQIFGGLGVTETSALYFWSPFNVPQTELAFVLIGMRTLFYLVNLLPLIYLPLFALFSGKSSALQNDRIRRK